MPKNNIFITPKCFIEHQLYLFGLNNSSIKDDIKQLFNNIKKYGLIKGALSDYVWNSNIHTLFERNFVFPNGKKSNLLEVLFRIFDVRAFYIKPVIIEYGEYYNTVRGTATAKEIIMYLLGKQDNISHAMLLNLILKSS